MKYSNQDDIVLMARFREGNQEAFEFLYRKYYRYIYNFAKRMLLTKQDAEDVAIDSFRKLWEKRDSFDSCPGVYSWLMIVTRNACLNKLRTQQYESEFRNSLPDFPDTNLIPEIEAQDYHIAIIKRIYAELDKLPPTCREVFILAFLKDLKNDEISRLLRLSDKQVRNYKNYALKQLRIKFLTEKMVAAIMVVLSVQLLLQV